MSESETPAAPSADLDHDPAPRARLVAVVVVVIVLVAGSAAVLLLRDRGSLGATYPATAGSPFSFRYPDEWTADDATIERGAVFVSPQGTPAAYQQAKLLGRTDAIAVLGSDVDSRVRIILELQAQQDGSVSPPVPMQIDDHAATKWRITLPGNDEGSGTPPFPRGGVMTGYQIELGDGHSIHLLIESSESGVDDELFDEIAASIRFDEDLLATALAAAPA
jgi:hypothetical protein